MTDTNVTPDTLKVLPQFDTTPKGRPFKRKFRGAKALMSHALTNGNRVDLTDPNTLQSLSANGLHSNQIASAVFDARKYFGLNVVSERTGRKVTSLTINF